MPSEYKIEINKREDLSIQGLKKLRKEGHIPGIYYSSTSKESTPIYLSQKDYANAIKSGAKIFSISVANKKQNVLFKSIDFHPVTDQVLHIDLYGIKMDQKVTIKVNIKLIGDSIGVKEEGGILNQPLNEIEIECLPADIPDFIEVDISKLSIGNSINAGNIKLDSKFSLATIEDAVIVSVTQPMKEVEVETDIDSDDAFLDEEKSEDSDGTEQDSDKTSDENDSDKNNNE